jgi:integrase
MAAMGRKRKNDLGLEPRVYASHGAFFYAHRDRGWERLGTDREKANAKGRLYNDPDGRYGSLVYWLDMFLVECERRVALKSTVKGVKLSPRTLQDYQDAIGTDDKPGALRVFFAPPLNPLDVTPDQVQDFLTANAEAERAVRGNRDKAALSSCFGWLLRTKKVPGLMVNPCLRGSGVQRNPETKRTRYVTHDEYKDVFDVATRAERLLMELTYRTLQRPESDIILWDSRAVSNETAGRFLRFKQNKTGRGMVIALSPALDALIAKPAGNVRQLVEPLVGTLKGGFYTYDGLSSMLKRSIAVANIRRKARGLEPVASFGYRDLKGKGATDMWLAGTRVEDIQALLGHANKTTTEIYIKQRWTESVQPNMVVIGA